MKKVFSIILVLLLVPLFVLAKQEIDLQGIQEILSGEPTKSEINQLIGKLKKEVKNNPEDHNLYAILAFVYDYISDYENELIYAELAVKHYPVDGEDGDIVFGNLARAYININKFDEAKPAIDKSLSYNPENLVNHIHLLNYYIAKDKYKEAALEFKTVSDLDKEKDYYYDLYIYSLKRLEKNGESIIKLYKEAVKANPDSFMAHRAYAAVLRNHTTDIEKDFPTIIQELKRSLELNPRYIFSYITIANAYLFRGLDSKNKRYFKEALAWLKKAEKLEPRNVKVAYAMGNCFIYTEDYGKGIEKLECAISLGDNSDQIIERLAEAYNGKAYSCYKAGKNLKQGLELIDKAIALKPNHGILLSTKAELLFKLGLLPEAHEYIKKAIALMPDEPEIKQDLENIEKALRKQKK